METTTKTKNIETTSKIIFYCQVKQITYNGRTFKAYKTQFGKLYVDVKFTKTSPYVPDESGYITLPADSININTEKNYPVIWVR